MRRLRIAVLMIASLSLEVGAREVRGAQPEGYETIVLPGGSSGIGFDDLRFSSSLGKVLVPAGRTGNLDLVDPETRVVTAIRGFSSQGAYAGGHGEGITSVDEGEGFLFVTDRTSLELHVVDPSARAAVAHTKLSAGPDYVRYVAKKRELWVTEPDAERIEVFALSESKPLNPVRMGSIRVPGGPESLVVDATHGRAYTHLWKGETVAIDVENRQIVERWRNGCRGSRGIALDEARGFLFVGCSEGLVVALHAARGGKEVGRVDTAAGVDIVDYDPTRRHLYVPAGRGASLSIVGVSKDGGLSVLGTVPVPEGAHCVVSDHRGVAYVCDPKGGRIVAVRDVFS